MSMLGVVPRMGTWVEMLFHLTSSAPPSVVPRMGTWVEIYATTRPLSSRSSRPPHGDVG